MFFTRRDSYHNELPFINKKYLLLFNNNKIVNSDNKNIPRENEFLRNFCIWRKSQGLFVPITWEK